MFVVTGIKKWLKIVQTLAGACMSDSINYTER